METISAPTRPVDAVRDAAREQRIAALAARRNPAATQRTTARPAVGPTGRDAVDARLAALADRRPPTRPGAAPAGRTKRRHAAKGARALSLGLSLASTGGLAAFFAMSNAEAGTQLQAATIVAAPAAPAASQTAAPSPTVVALSVPGVTATATPAAVPVPVAATPTTAPATVAPAPAASNTIVQGGVFHNKWGDVQVQATFAADGTLVDVVTLQTPDRDGKSVRINDRAVPQLNSEALTSQTAQVDTVSGATYTSTDYRNSLQSAIDAARAAGLTAIA